VHGDILAKLAAIIDAGKLKPLLDAQAFGFAEVGAAYAHLSSGRAVGKVVVEV
jgi:NADPH:quinone reductase